MYPDHLDEGASGVAEIPMLAKSYTRNSRDYRKNRDRANLKNRVSL